MVQKQLQEFHHRPNLPFPCIKEKADQEKEKIKPTQLTT
jgi:hypothetical protein